MKIFLGCLNVNGLGGSELYHYELARELHLSGNDVTLFTLRNIDSNDQVRIKLAELGVRQLDLTTININEQYDIIVVSQPQTVLFVLDNFKNIPIISIIHSEIRSEDPILDSRISHYIGIRRPIVDMLKNDYKIDSNKISLIYNPIDRSRFNSNNKIQTKKHTGIFVGEVLDSIRFQAVSHLVRECIQNDWDLKLMSASKYNFNHPNITYVERTWYTENTLKEVDFTAGILIGRTTLEGWCSDVPGYVYLIDKHGNVTDIDTTMPSDIKELCDSKYVVKKHLEIYNKINN